MSWQAKSKLPLFFALLFSHLLFSCQDNIEVGQPPRNMAVVFTDTVTVKTSTVLIDSVQSSNGAYLLVGQYNDPYFGKITAKSFFALSPRPVAHDFGSNPQFQKLTMVLYKQYAYGDTTRSQTVYVHKVAEPIVKDGRYYSFESKAIDPTPLGSKTFAAKDIFGRVVEIDLSDSFRDEIVSLLQSTDSLTQEQLDGVLNGLALVPDAGDDAAILGFSASSALLSFLRLEYLDDNGDTQYYYIGVRPASITTGETAPKAVRFNQVTADRSGTALAGVGLYEPVPETSLGNAAYMQGLLGVGTKIEFPYLAEFHKLGLIAINQAYLLFSPIVDVENPFYSLPATFHFIELDAEGKPVKIPVTRSVSGSTIVWEDTTYRKVQTEGFDPLGVSQDMLVYYDPLTRSYNANITSYTQYVMNGLSARYQGNAKKDNYGLLIAPSTLNNEVNRIIIGGHLHPQKRLHLRLFYSIIQTE
jgi:hypothetical protein